jgi:hypothetical protein
MHEVLPSPGVCHVALALLIMKWVAKGQTEAIRQFVSEYGMKHKSGWYVLIVGDYHSCLSCKLILRVVYLCRMRGLLGAGFATDNNSLEQYHHTWQSLLASGLHVCLFLSCVHKPHRTSVCFFFLCIVLKRSIWL